MHAFGDMDTPKAEYATGEMLRLRQHVQREAREAALLDAISRMSFIPALREHVRCHKEYEDWLLMPRRTDRSPSTGRALQAKALQSIAATRLAARACGRHLRAEGIEPQRMVILIKQIVERVLDETKLDRPDPLRMGILTWAIEGYYGGD